ncbi:MAG: DNA methyltransferase [Inhella sp.]|jgi:adenine-specific DNA-methyltransferase|uniref:site-specific DNA-methyltransferase n=1 Tax=Inhella sp. TaxID=1921806 RepID=UPI0022C09E56|nr:DNA methyltransferase [Inhella sp.]MCZ8234803.1 DNA methyltransferase [Inhella sp.]
MAQHQKLELTWIGKELRPRLEPRVLFENTERSYHAKHRLGDTDHFDNRLIKGDNLLALKALESEFAGKVKCVFIDPPYNTGSAFEHYDDGVEHSIWLGLMRDRLELIRGLLAPNGSLWITIDDTESHYLKVLCDEVFGRKNFVANVVWEKVYTPKSNGRGLSADHDHLLVYARSEKWFDSGWNMLPRSDEQQGRFKNLDNDPDGPWRTYPLDVRTEDGAKREKYRYEVILPSGRTVKPAAGRHWALPLDEFNRQRASGEIYFGKDGNAMPTRKVYLKNAKQGVIARTWWPYKEVTGNQDAKREILALFGDSGFITPKPEALLQRVLTIATNPGDLVLDSFGGSGTTGAVAHKMGRRWIMVEIGDHADTHIVPRLKKVIDGEDRGGVTESTGWKGGGGFRYYTLAPTLLKTDRWGNLVINPAYDPAMLAAAMCKLEGFTYAPSDALWWQHGHSSERDLIYVTTQTLSAEQLAALSEELGEDRSLLVCCGAYRGVTAAQAAERWPNLTIKKIPKMVKDRCEWGHDDYSLNVKNLPMAQAPAVQPSQDDLFGEEPVA